MASDHDRQRAVKAILREIDVVLVIRSRNSSKSNRLVEVNAAWENVSFRAPVELQSSGVA